MNFYEAFIIMHGGGTVRRAAWTVTPLLYIEGGRFRVGKAWNGYGYVLTPEDIMAEDWEETERLES